MFDVEAYLPYIKASAARFVGFRGSDHYEDLIQEGVVALLMAYKTYDEDNPVSFITYSRRALFGSFTNYMRRQKIVVKLDNGRPVNGDVLVFPLENNMSTDYEEYDFFIEREELIVDDKEEVKLLDLLRAAENLLTDEEYDIFTRLIIDGESKVSLAKERGVTRQGIQYRMTNIIKKLRGE